MILRGQYPGINAVVCTSLIAIGRSVVLGWRHSSGLRLPEELSVSAMAAVLEAVMTSCQTHVHSCFFKGLQSIFAIRTRTTLSTTMVTGKAGCTKMRGDFCIALVRRFRSQATAL